MSGPGDAPDADPGWEELEAPYLHWFDEPAPAERRLLRRVLVRLLRSRRLHAYDGGDLGLAAGELVLVDTPVGKELGVVEGVPAVVLHDGPPPRKVLRRGAGADERRDRALRDREDRAREAVAAEVDRHRLPMRLVAVTMPHGDGKAVVHFVAEDRIDFRSLVKDLSRALRCRVEMRQIGARDAAGQLGGAGICGLELCCTTWLKGFDPVSIRHAKSQGLEMQLEKFQGVCGRLMCCLVYEHAAYKVLRQGLPKVGKIIDTPAGPGRVREVNVPARRVRVQTESGEQRTFSADELGLPQPVEGADEPESPASPAASDDAAPFSRAGRRPRRRRGHGGEGPPGAA